MALMEYQTTLPHPIEEVFARTVDLENAPHWHAFFTAVQQLTDGPIALGSRWQINYGVGSFALTITDYQPPHRAVFQGSRSIGGMIPNFTIAFTPSEAGTDVHYTMHPDIPALLQPLIQLLAPPYGRRDLDRYFRELNILMA